MFWAVAVLLVVGVVVLTDAGTTAVDTKPQLYLNPDAVLRASLSAWQGVPALGQRSYESGLLLPALVATPLHAVGLPAWLVMRTVRVVLVLLGMAGAWWLARHLVGGSWGPRVAAVVQGVHPYALVAGATLPVLWPSALLPWMLGCLVFAVRSRRSWPAWTGAAALAVWAMGGQNAGSVVLLQLAVTVPVVLWWAASTGAGGWRRPVAVVTTLGAAVLVLSASWLVPGLAATGSGAAVVAQTETGASISAVSSWSEVVRGLGLWPLYGTDGTTPWVQPHVALVTVPAVVVAGFALLAGSWWALARADRRPLRLALGLVAVAGVVMVGSHPWEDPPPLGLLWQGALEAVPALGALRTTNKAGAGLVVGVALLAALVVEAARRPARRAALVAGVAAVAVLPLWTGGLFVSTADVPGYWTAAVRATDERGPRLWLLPGQANSAYTWTDERPDDVPQGLYDEREVLVRTTVANSTPEGASLLAGLDRRLQEGTLPPKALAAVSRYLGVGTLVARGDVDTAGLGGADPARVAGAVAASEGVTPGPTFGRPVAAGAPPPVSVFRVTDPVGPVTAMDLGSLVTVVGDGAAVPDLAQLGLLDGSQPFVLAGDLPTAAAPGLLGRSARVVLTDTNLRAQAVPNRLTEDRGPLLAADDGPTRTAGLWDADDQTVRVPRGWSAAATREGSTFRPLPWAAAENAVDGDPSTAWYAGDFGTAVGSELTVTSGTPAAGDLEVTTAALGEAQVGRLTLLVDGVARELRRADDGRFVGSLPRGTRSFTLRVGAVSPAGSPTNVGISEVSVDGDASPAADVTRTPLTLDRLLAATPPAERAALASRPFDVVLARRLGAALSPVVEEPQLRRVVTLPWEGSFAVRGLFRLGAPLPEAALDEAEGATGAVRATSSSQAFGLPTGRASMALDGDDGTGWQPAEPAVGETWDATFADPVTTSEVTLVQPPDGRQLTEVVLRVDGEDVRARLNPGRTTVELPRRTDVSRLGVTVTGVSEPATGPARLLEVEVGDRRIERTGGSGCLTVATIDGRAVRVRPAAPVTDRAFLGGPCGDPTALSAGAREWAPADGFVPDVVVWSNGPSTAGVAAATPVVDLDNGSPAPGTGTDPGWSGRLPERDRDVVVVAGVGYDPGWHLEVDGRDLGASSLVNGHAAGWVVPAGGPARLDLSFGPQRAATAGLLTSALAVLLAVGLVLSRRRALSADLAESRVAGGLPALPPPTRHHGSSPWWRRLGAAGGWLVLGGLVLGVAGVAAAALGLALRPLGRRLVAVVLTAGWVAVVAAWFVGAADLLGTVTPDLVAATSAAHLLAGGVVLASVVWVVGRDGDAR